MMWDFPSVAIRVLRRLPAGARRVCARGAIRLGDAWYRIAEGVLWTGRGDLHPKHRLMGYHEWFTSRVGPEDVVLDVGSGVGALADDVAAVAREVVGVDVSEENVAEARRRYLRPNLTFLVADASTFALDRAYTCAVLSNILEHLDEREALLRRLGDAGMRLLIRVPAWDRSWWVPAREELGLDSRLDPTHRIEYTAESLKRELTAAGLTLVSMERRWSEFYVEAERAEVEPRQIGG